MIKILVALMVVGACTETQAPISGTTSLEVTLVSPDPGDVDHRIAATETTVVVNIQAMDANGKLDTTYNKLVPVYAHYLGTLTPYLDIPTGLLTIPLSMTAPINVVNGVANNVTIKLPSVFGPTTIWFDDDPAAGATYAAGVSPTLWYRDPFVSDIQTPTSETAIDAYSNSPLNGKNIGVHSSRYGANGLLVVTSVFAQGYTVADVKCMVVMTPPCVADSYDYLEVFSFSAPLDQHAQFISEGQVIAGFAGGISEFDGLTEIGFPQTFVSGTPVINKAFEPPIVKMDPTWFNTNKINFERNEAGAIEVDGGVVCPLDADYTTYKQWKIDPAGVGDAAACGGKNLINVISSGVATVDPGTLVGKTVPRIVGMLRPVNIGTFNVWIIYPRSDADITIN
ncbi:MAG: hypothetical protein ABJE66_25310 [Deltaproteobacteria bacterium]